MLPNLRDSLAHSKVKSRFWRHRDTNGTLAGRTGSFRGGTAGEGLPVREITQ